MFSDNRGVNTVKELLAELRRYFLLQKRYVALEVVSKLIVLLSALALGMILFLVGAVAFILVALCLATLAGELMGSMVLGYAAVALAFVALALVVYANRARWITAPIVGFLGRLFLNDDNERQ